MLEKQELIQRATLASVKRRVGYTCADDASKKRERMMVDNEDAEDIQ
jgi:hypothetical protein